MLYWTRMAGSDLEHRTEIRRANRATPIWIGVVVLAAVVTFVLGRDAGGTDEGASPSSSTSIPSTPTSETLTTTSPRELPPVFGVTSAPRGLLPLSTSVGPASDPVDGSGPVTGPIDPPVVTGERVVVLTEDARLHAGAPGEPFRPVACCWDELHPSNERDHVWGRAGPTVTLIDLDRPSTAPAVRLDVGDERILGPASFGVVTVDGDGLVRWHRPSFDPEPVGLPDDRRPLDAGGERLLLAAPAVDGRAARLEVASITFYGVLHTFELPAGASHDGVLAPDGSSVALPVSGGWEVRDAADGELRGRLPKVDRPVWVGGTRFAGLVDDRIVVSDGGELPLRWPVLAVAERAPSERG